MIEFDINNPICYYCNNFLVFQKSEIHQLYDQGLSRQEIAKTLKIYVSTVAKELLKKQAYICAGCNEYVIANGKLGTIISCGNINFVMSDHECIILHGNSKLSVPPFNVNFSSKEKLYNKLKNYIIFS